VTRQGRKLRNEEHSNIKKILLGEQVKENEMGGTCSTHAMTETHI
jgi:hypothetical protein